MTAPRSRIRRPLLLATAAALLALGPAPGVSQGVTYTSVTDARFGGMLGAMAGLAGAGDTEETTYIEGRKIRTDSDGRTTLVDFEEGRFTWIDHASRTYSVMTVDRMVEAARSAGAAATGQAPADPAEEGGMEWSFRLDIDRTGRSERVAGYDAEEVILTLMAEATGTDAGSGETATMEMAFVNQLWLSAEPEAYRLMKDVGGEASDELAGELQGAVGSFQAAFAQDPRMQAGLERIQEEAAELDGMALRSVSHIVLVPPGQELDLEAALQGPTGPDVAGGAADAARDAVSRRLGGLFGRKKAGSEEAAPEQATIMSLTTEVTEMRSGVPEGAFDIPDGYRQVEAPGG